MKKNLFAFFDKNSENITAMLFPSILGIFLCAVCLAGTTWAWFTANREIGVAPIVSAQWMLESVEIYEVPASGVYSQGEEGEKPQQIPVSVTENDGVIEFEASANTRYLVTVTVEGNAVNGFVLVNTCDGSFYITEKQSSFTLLLSEDCKVKISSSWGTKVGEAAEFTEGEELGSGVIEVQEPPKCICFEKCVEESVNEDCTLCLEDIDLCEGEETGKVLCSCETKCTELTESCAVCVNDIDSCTGEELQSEETETEQEDELIFEEETEQEDIVLSDPEEIIET